MDRGRLLLDSSKSNGFDQFHFRNSILEPRTKYRPLLRGEMRGVSHMRRKIIPYEPYLKVLARKLRNNSTKSEIKLWMALKGKRLSGYDFHRQKPLDKFIADFYCYEFNLVIELDGATHLNSEVQNKDRIKEQKLNELGLAVLRFPDKEVLTDLSSVLDKIEEYILQFKEEHTPNPSQEGSL